LGVLLYCCLQVYFGRWSHIDANHPRERRAFNRFLLMVFSVCAAALAWFQPHAREVRLGLSLSCFIIVAAMVASRWLKVSLHVAFLIFAAIVLWQASVPLMAAALGFTVAVGWSRVELGRHSVAEVLAGSALGLIAGGALWFVVLQVWA
jgi:membrane-associated phospholipid phosphatase